MTEDMMSPVRKTQRTTELPVTPGKIQLIECRIHQPSPNRTEAAAAMMHLLTGSQPSANPPKVKRRYVRRAPKKAGSGAKRQIKTAWLETGEKGDVSKPKDSLGKPPVKRSAKAEEKTGDWRMEGDEVKFIPFREYNRKEKSLGLLCENFLKLYRDDKIGEVCLDKAATELGVERRRIYDIVNILESIHLVSRKSKNLYNWHGLASLPMSITAMKQRYLEMHQNSPSAGVEYPPIKNDRRRGKSLSKLSQMFVQLFLEKEDCIIPLDQAAKQLIQLEDSESEEDRLLKTKIRRLYDVANVLVSVGLIEKLQLSNSRKPVFRWKSRSQSADQDEPMVKSEVIVAKPIPTYPAGMTPETISSADTIQDVNMAKSPQSCDSDMFEEGSDSQSDSSNCGAKRKQDEQDASDDSMSDGDSSTKRSRPSERKSSTASEGKSLLRMDLSNMPVHPQMILAEQQEALNQYMLQYCQEYVDYLAQHHGDDVSSFATEETPTKVAGMTKHNGGTPLADEIQDLLLSESSQSVAEIVAARVLRNPRPPIAVEPETELSPRPSVLAASSAKLTSFVKTVSPAASASRSTARPASTVSKDEEEQYDAPRNLIMALQPRSQS